MSASDADASPNVLVFVCDDLGYGDLGRHGNTVVATPVLDCLHDEAVRMRRFYGGPVCSPARASLIGSVVLHSTIDRVQSCGRRGTQLQPTL